MYKINFNQPLHIHFIGIGGISMSGLAEILLEEHFTISGSDTKESGLTRHLEHMGARIFYGQKAENLSDDIDLIVYTAAIREDNPEYAAAKESSIPMLSRAELLGQIMDNLLEHPAPFREVGEHIIGRTSRRKEHHLRCPGQAVGFPHGVFEGAVDHDDVLHPVFFGCFIESLPGFSQKDQSIGLDLYGFHQVIQASHLIVASC